MATKSPTQYHNHWGAFGSTSVLPNVSGSPTQDAALEQGDLAWVTADLSTYQCVVPTAGSATWSKLASGNGVIESALMGLGYLYVQAVSPVEEVTGQGTFDGGTVGSGKKAVFRSVVRSTFSIAGNGYVRLYDLGPVGTPAAARLVSVLNVTTSGLHYLSQDLTIVSASPTVNQILDARHVYEVTAEQVSQANDSVYVGFSSISVETV